MKLNYNKLYIVVMFVLSKQNDMKTYSDKIVKAYEKWIDAINSEPSESYDPKYKPWKAKEKRCANNFEKYCEADGLKYCEVYKELLGNKPMVINQY